MKDKFMPKASDKSVISIRLDDELIEQLDDYSKKQRLSRNEFIRQCIVFALERIDNPIQGDHKS